MSIQKIVLTFLFISTVHCVFSQETVLGKWITIDDETGEKKSVIELYIEGEQLQGKVIELYLRPEEDQNPTCTECDGDLNGKPIMGMQVLKNMQFDKSDNEWEGGEILDPENGTSYDCKIWLVNGKLQVRGYVAFFFRTQTWERLK